MIAGGAALVTTRMRGLPRSPQRAETAAVATVRRHLGLKDHVSRPFRIDAAAQGARGWLSSQGGAVRAQLANNGPSRPATAT